MSQDNKEMEKKDSQMLTISIISLLMVLLFIIEIYEIINDPANLIAIGALGVFTLAAVYAQMHFIGRMLKKRQAEQEEAFNNVYRSEKASYLLMRKYFDQMEEKMDSFSSQISAPYRDLVAAQKALAKVQINRSKQNANALLISNDKMLHKIREFQKEMINADNGLSEQDKAAFIEGNKEILEKQQEILSALQELETSLKNEILESANKMASIQSQLMARPESQVSAEDKSQLQALDMENEFKLDDSMSLQTGIESSSESDLDKLLMGMNNEESELQPIAEDMHLQPTIEEPELQSIMEEPELGPMIDVLENESVKIEEPVISNITNKNTIMSPDEISAMIANAGMDDNQKDLELQPIMEEPELQPIGEEPVLEAIMEESELQPIGEEPVLEPIMEEPELQPIGEEPVLEPIVEEPELQPIAEELQLQPIMDEELSIMEEPELESSMIDDIDIDSIKLDELSVPELSENDITISDEISAMMADMDLTENEEETELKPLITEQSMKPIMDESNLQSMVEESQLQPMATELESQLIIEQPDVESELHLNVLESELQSIKEPPTMAEPETQPVMEQSTMAEPETQPVMEPPTMAEPETQPVMEQESDPQLLTMEKEEPQLQPIMTESDLEAMLNQLDDNPRAAINTKSEHIDKADAEENKAAVEEVKENSSDVNLLEEDMMELNHGKMPDKIKAMIANLGTDTEPVSKDADMSKEILEPELKPLMDDTESELDQIMKAMDIDDIMETPEEDLDIDKILEVPLTGMKSDQTGVSNANQVMSSDEIAALIANTDLLSEPEPSRKNDGMPDLSDPGHVMSSDEIAALIANL